MHYSVTVCIRICIGMWKKEGEGGTWDREGGSVEVLGIGKEEGGNYSMNLTPESAIHRSLTMT